MQLGLLLPVHPSVLCLDCHPRAGVNPVSSVCLPCTHSQCSAHKGNQQPPHNNHGLFTARPPSAATCDCDARPAPQNVASCGASCPPLAACALFSGRGTLVYAGKRQRLREHGIWLMEEESYFTDGNFLHVVDPEEGFKHIIDQYAPVCVRGSIRQQGLEQYLLRCIRICRTGNRRMRAPPLSPGDARIRSARVDPLTVLDIARAYRRARVCKETDPIQSKCWHGENLVKKSIEEGVSPRNPEAYTDPCKPHLEVQGWLRGALRNAIVLSRLLNRTLVLPRLDCYCER